MLRSHSCNNARSQRYPVAEGGSKASTASGAANVYACFKSALGTRLPGSIICVDDFKWGIALEEYLRCEV